jgi:putative endonuclease
MWNWIARCWPGSRASGKLGDRGEDLAAKYLQSKGMRIVERQLRGLYGELDLVAIDAETVVFIEVKTRTSNVAGSPTEAVTPAKQKKITQSALAYLKRRKWLQRRCRFDVVSIVWAGDSPADITHFPAAFDATGFGQMYS